MEYAPEPTVAQLGALADAMAPGRTIRFVRRLPGGLGCTMDVLEVDGAGARRPFRVLLRRQGPWFADGGAASAHREFTVLELLTTRGLPVPEPLWLDREGIFEPAAMVLGYIDAFPQPNPADPVAFATQLALMLVRLHSVDVGDALARLLPDYNAREQALLADSEPPERVAGHHLGQALWARQRELVGGLGSSPRVLLHGDYWPGNTLWSGTVLRAVIDFEEAGVGDPALDVATAVVNLGFEPWRAAADRFLEVYRGETGLRLETLRFWSLRELRRPMPDIAAWHPSFVELGSRPDLTVEELRDTHAALLRELL